MKMMSDFLRWCSWIPAFAGMALLFNIHAFADDDLSSTVRTTTPTGLSSTQRSTEPTGLSSTVRTKPIPNSSVDPMLDTSAPNPKDSLNTDDMTSSEPMLSTAESTPDGTTSTSQPETAKKKSATTIDPRFCNALTKATPRADVTAQPGMDVNGRTVAPADVPGQQQIQLPSKINIPLTFNLAQTLHLNTNSYPYNTLGQGTEGLLGTLTVEGNKVSFNGQPISDTDQDNLAVLCMKQK